jgi:hypothetical protein
MSEFNKPSERIRFFIIASSLFWIFLMFYSLLYRYPKLKNSNAANGTNLTLNIVLTTPSNIFINLSNDFFLTTDSTLPSVFNLSKGLKSSSLYKDINCKQTDMNITLCETIGDKSLKQSETINDIIKKKIIGKKNLNIHTSFNLLSIKYIL